jgi:hypothetical protein
MSFDPENVTRWTDFEYWLNDEELGSMDAVAASDYDQLLADYRALKQRLQILEARPHPQPRDGQSL